MNLPEKFWDVLQREGVAAIATQGPDGPHLANTWNSYIQVGKDGRLLIPAGGMHHTEANLATLGRVALTVGSREVAGQHGMGTGFLIKGTAAFETSGPGFDAVKARFGWARAALAITVESAAQTL